MPGQLPAENGLYSLRVTGSGGLTFTNETNLTVDQKCVSMFVQTDKGIYKPGQTGTPVCLVFYEDLNLIEFDFHNAVMMRFIAYKSTLLPYSGNIEVSIMVGSINTLLFDREFMAFVCVISVGP